jgi:hypothetical protein
MIKTNPLIIRKLFVAMLVLLFLASACSPGKPSSAASPTISLYPTTTPLPTETPFPVRVNIEIHLDDIQQTVGHIGSGNFIHFFGGSTSATEAVSQMNIEQLQPKYARVSIELQEWEPFNDNNDPQSINPTAFFDDRHNHATFELLKLFKEKDVEITASVWRVPGWLVEDPQDDSSRTISRSKYPEAIESIAAWLLHARDQYGVEVDYLSFNEPNLGVTVLLSPEDNAEMIRVGGRRFKELGLRTKWLLGDCASIRGCLDYVIHIWAVEDIRLYLGPLAFHNWDGVNVSNNAIIALGEWAVENGMEVRCTEGGWDAQLWQRSSEFSGWTNARQLAISYNRVLKMSRATAFYYWEMMGNDYQLNDGVKPYPVMQVLQQMSEAFPPGTQILGTTPNNSAVYWVAGMTPSGDISVHIVSNTVAERARVTGLPNGAYDLFISTREEFSKHIQTFKVTDGTLLFDLPGFSVALLKTQH